MIISDEMWNILAPSTEPYEDITREDLESGLENGEFVMLDMEKAICSYAREKGFVSVEIIGRPGWERVLPNYERTAVLLRKELSHGVH